MPSLDLAAALHAERHAAGGPDPITPSSIGAAPKEHAANHATGGSDPITPESIGAAADPTGTGKNAFVFHGTSHEGHANDAPLGAVWVRTPEVTAENGYPPGGAGLLETVLGMSPSYMRQMFSRAGGEEVWARVIYGGSWQPWRRLVTDNDPRLLDTGVRQLTHWTDGVIDYQFAGVSPPQGMEPIAGEDGGILVHRQGDIVRLYIGGAVSTTTTAQIFLPRGFGGGFIGGRYTTTTLSRGAGAPLAARIGSRFFIDTGGAGEKLPSNSSYFCTATWVTTEPRPTEPYPGTPV